MGEVIASVGWIVLARPHLLAALPLAAAPWVLARRARARGRRQSPVAVAAQCLALAAVVVALTGPRAALGGRARLGCLLAVDASGSVRGQVAPAAERLRAAVPSGVDVEEVFFAERLTRRPTGPADRTAVGPALRMIASRARAGLPGAVLATDGRFTDERWPPAASAAAAAGAEVLIVPMNAPPPDARVAALSAGRAADGGVRVVATVAANAGVRRTLVVTRTAGGGERRVLLRRALTLLPEAPATVRVADAPAADAAAEYEASLVEAEAVGENDSATVLVLPVRRRVAAVAADAALRRLLAGAGEPPSALSPAELPASPAALARYAAVVLVDATGEALSAEQRRALAGYVRAGGGLLLIGAGPHAVPADRDDPLNRVLPLTADPFRRRPLHLSVVLDRSASMGELTAPAPGRPRQVKFDLAAEAVVALKDHLTDRDALMVVTFAGKARRIYDSGSGPPDFADLRRRLDAVRPAGSTRVTPALAEALKAPTPRGLTPMVLVLSDLETETFDPGGWARRLKAGRVRLAVVAVGRAPPTAPAATAPAAPPPLARLTERLGADAWYVRRDRLAGLARVFADLVRRGRGSVLQEGPQAVRVVGPLFGTELEALGDLDGVILSAARGPAEVLARTAAGDPLLARRRAGLGRTVALAAPLDGGHNRAWRASPATAKLLPSAVRWTARPEGDPRFHADLRRQDATLVIAVRAGEPGEPLNGLSLTAACLPAGEAGGEGALTVPLDQVAPGRYRGEASCPSGAPAAVMVRGADGSAVWRGSAAATYPREYRRLGADREALRRLAELTGGRVVAADRLAGALTAATARRMTELWPWLIAFAAAIVLAEWCLARVTRR